jgi:hypothetical protein
MIDERVLRDVLVLVATEQKKLYLMLSSVLNELAAVRESVRGLDPTFSEVLQHKQEELGREDASVSAQVRILDESIGKAMRVVYYR